MTPPEAPRDARAYPGLLVLCILLWVFAAIAGGIAAWLMAQGLVLYGGISLLIAGLLAAAGIGLYRMRRWGVIVFGVLAALGSINHLSSTFLRYEHLSAGDPLGVLSALVGIVSAIALPVLFAYLILILWRRAR